MVSSSTGLPSTLPPKSSMAILAASTEPGPPLPEYGPLRSPMRPMRTTSSEIWAWARPATAARPAVASTARKAAREWRKFFIPVSPAVVGESLAGVSGAARRQRQDLLGEDVALDLVRAAEDGRH